MRKYAALIFLVVSLTALVWGAVLTMRSAMVPLQPLPVSAGSASSSMDGNLVLAQLRRASQLLARLDALPPSSAAGVAGPLAQNSSTPVAKAPLFVAGKAAASATAPAKEPKTTISMIYVSSDMQRAVINGQLYARGDVMPGGGRLTSISLKEVVIESEKGQRTVVKAPQSQMAGATPTPVNGALE
jgi:hypothetical protein